MPVLGSQASAALTLGKGVGWEVRVSEPQGFAQRSLGLDVDTL